MEIDPAALWLHLPVGYLATVSIETPVLLVGLSPPHTLRRRLAAGFWLTACTYPIVVLVLPLLLPTEFWYLLVAETFAPLAECLLFAALFHGPDVNRPSRLRDFGAIVVANLLSFGLGELYYYLRG